MTNNLIFYVIGISFLVGFIDFITDIKGGTTYYRSLIFGNK